MANKVYQQVADTGSSDKDKTDKTLVFLVVTDDLSADGDDLLDENDGITRIPAVNEVIGNYRVKSKDWTRDAENPNHFKINVKLSDAQDDASGSAPSGGEKLNIDIKVSTVRVEEPVYLDGENVPIINAAGQPFSNQPTQTYYDERIVISFVTGQVDQTNIDKCRGAVNSGSINFTVKGWRRTFATETLLLDDATVSSKMIEGLQCWQMEYVLLYRRDTWTRRILNMGRMERKDGELRPIKLKDGMPATEDVPLDKDGKAILDGAIVAAVAIESAGAGQRCYMSFKIEDRVKFTGLLSGIR